MDRDAEEAFAAHRPRKARTWMRSRETELLRIRGLELDANALRSEIRSLETTRSLLRARTFNRQGHSYGQYVKLVRLYMEFIRDGYQEQVEFPAIGPLNARAFHYAFLDEDMRMGRLPGVDQFIQMSERYSAALSPMRHELVHAEVLTPDRDDNTEVVVRARATFTATITAETFLIVFPHLLGADQFERTARLREELLGSEISLEGWYDFTFDTATDRVRLLDPRHELLPALAQLLPNPFDLEVLMNGALLTPDGCIGDLRGFELLDAAGSPRFDPRSASTRSPDQVQSSATDLETTSA